MSLVRKIITSGLVLSLALVSAGAAFAAEETKEETSDANGILFRIENIKPQKNSDGLIDKCKFIITVYNRMGTAVKSATLNFKWVDNISGKFVVDGDKIKAVDAKKAVTVISKEVTLDSIGAHKQRSFEDVVDTDKCFLLFDSLEYNVKSCHLDNESSSRDRKGNGGCADRFNYITSKNPEYYSEFKDVPDSVIERQVSDEKEREVKKINQTVTDSLSELRSTSEILGKIK